MDPVITTEPRGLVLATAEYLSEWTVIVRDHDGQEVLLGVGPSRLSAAQQAVDVLEELVDCLQREPAARKERAQ